MTNGEAKVLLYDKLRTMLSDMPTCMMLAEALAPWLADLLTKDAKTPDGGNIELPRCCIKDCGRVAGFIIQRRALCKQHEDECWDFK